jgi:hypothetical protein
MSKRCLQLRSLPVLAISYVVTPLISLTIASWIVSLEFTLKGQSGHWSGLWFGFVLTATPPIFLIELVFLTPMLVAYGRYQWRWANTYVACAAGFGVGMLIWGAVLTMFKWVGLVHYVTELVGAGLFGVANALIFRLIAVKSVIQSGA